MSRLAKELAFTATSLYRYVASRDELLVLVADSAAGPPPPMNTSDWRSGLASWVREQLTVIRAHLWWVAHPDQRAALNPSSVRWMESGMQVLAGSGLREVKEMGIIQLLAGYVLNQVWIEIEITQAHLAAGVTDPSTVGRDYGRALGRLIDAERFPALTSALSGAVFGDVEPLPSVRRRPARAGQMRATRRGVGSRCESDRPGAWTTTSPGAVLGPSNM